MTRLLLALFFVTTTAAARDSMAIQDFTDSSGNSRINQDVLDSLMQDLPSKILKHWTYVERDKTDTLQKEMKFGSDGYTREGTSPELGNATGAKYLLTGTITEYATKKATNPYSEKRSVLVTVRMVVNFKLLNYETSELHHADRILVTHKYKKSGSSDSDLARMLGRKAADQIGASLDKYMANQPKAQAVASAAKTYKFHFKSNPEGAQVDIDEFNEGATPFALDLAPGKHKIRIYMPGYEDSVLNVNARRDRTVEVTLKRKQDAVKTTSGGEDE